MTFMFLFDFLKPNLPFLFIKYILFYTFYNTLSFCYFPHWFMLLINPIILCHLVSIHPEPSYGKSLYP